MGRMGVSLDGARRRDIEVAQKLDGTPSVWLPGGGYCSDSWKVLAGTAIAIALRTLRPIKQGYDPLDARFRLIAAGLRPEALEEDGAPHGDVESSLGLSPNKGRLFLDFYTAHGLEHGLYAYGIFDHLRRLGYEGFKVTIDSATVGDRARLVGRAIGSSKEHVLIELVAERKTLRDRPVLYVHWLSLRHPRLGFDAARPQLPGQDAPGLGLAREMSEILARIAERLGLAGVAFRPAWFHTAYAARYRAGFADAARQGRFEALLRDMAHVPLTLATRAIAEGKVTLNGKPYTWEADEMVRWLDGSPVVTEEDVPTEVTARASSRFLVTGN